jgi:hypothetical protein
MGSRVCEKLTDFMFAETDVSYDAHNDIKVTDQTVVRLAKSCPNLKVVQLQGIYGMPDAVLLTFLRYCPNLTSLELSGVAQKFSADAFLEIQDHPEWTPKLKSLLLTAREGGDKESKAYMKEMRNLTRQRHGLVVTLVDTMEVKKWGDWEQEITKINYKKGREQSRRLY